MAWELHDSDEDEIYDSMGRSEREGSVSSEDSTGFLASNLADAISECEVENVDDVKRFLARHQEGGVDVIGHDGQTPLMAACDCGVISIIKFLLSNGANAMYSSKVDGNTPLHVACMAWAEYVDGDSNHDEDTKKKIMEERGTRINIIRLLLHHGALVLEKNFHGLSPLDLAALHGNVFIVKFFMDDEGSHGFSWSVSERIRVLEFLAISQSVCASQHVSDAFDTFCKVLSLRECAPGPPQSRVNTELEALFACREIRTTEDMVLLKDDEHAIQVQGFLMAERVLPESGKEKYLWRPLASIAVELGKTESRADEGCNILKYLMSLESQSRLRLGTVVSRLDEGSLGWFSVTPHLPLFCKVVSMYRDVVNTTGISSVIESGPYLLEHLARFVVAVARYGEDADLTESVTTLTEEVTVAISQRSLTSGESCLVSTDLFSVSHCIMKCLSLKVCFRFNWLIGQADKEFVGTVMRIVSRLLHCDNVKYADEDDCTSLHVLMEMAYHVPNLYDTSRSLVLLGCPVHAVNKDEETAMDILRSKHECLKIPVDRRLVALLMKREDDHVLTLAELASKSILLSNVPYHGKLPPKISRWLDEENVKLDRLLNSIIPCHTRPHPDLVSKYESFIDITLS